MGDRERERGDGEERRGGEMGDSADGRGRSDKRGEEKLGLN